MTTVLDDLTCLIKQGARQMAKAYHIDNLWHMRAALLQPESNANDDRYLLGMSM